MMPRAKKSFGQNFLNDPSVIRKIVAAAEIVPGETVLEIGPGTGVLTQALVDAGAKVVAVEAEQDLIEPLQHQFGDRISLIEGDIMTLPTVKLPHSYKLIANIPYNITSAVLERFLAHEPNASRLVLMVQREVADRMVAGLPPARGGGKGGGRGLLSVVCQLYAEVKRVCVVPRGAFRPIPKVDSAVVLLDKSHSSHQSHEPERVIALAKAGFRARRKQLHGNLAAAGVVSSAQAKQLLEEQGIDSKARAEILTVENWIALSEKIAKLTHR